MMERWRVIDRLRLRLKHALRLSWGSTENVSDLKSQILALENEEERENLKTELSRMETERHEEQTRLQAEMKRLLHERHKAKVDAFCDQLIVLEQKAFPCEREAIASVYMQAIIDDEADPLAGESRAEKARASFHLRESHAWLTKEFVADSRLAGKTKELKVVQ